jgi:hypothetical protein
MRLARAILMWHLVYYRLEIKSYYCAQIHDLLFYEFLLLKRILSYKSNIQH